MNIKHGATVWLKSGGPKMTVDGVSMGKNWVCKWFVGQTLSHGTFHEDALTTEDPNTLIVGTAHGGNPKANNKL